MRNATFGTSARKLWALLGVSSLSVCLLALVEPSLRAQEPVSEGAKSQSKKMEDIGKAAKAALDKWNDPAQLGLEASLQGTISEIRKVAEQMTKDRSDLTQAEQRLTKEFDDKDRTLGDKTKTLANSKLKVDDARRKWRQAQIELEDAGLNLQPNVDELKSKRDLARKALSDRMAELMKDFESAKDAVNSREAARHALYLKYSELNALEGHLQILKAATGGQLPSVQK